MTHIRTVVVAGALAIGVALGAIGCGGGDNKPGGALESIKKAGKLRVAIDPTYPPMEFQDAKGIPVGFDPDIASDVAKRLGVQIEFVVSDWEGIIGGLDSGRYDIIISSMNINDERKKKVDFIEYAGMAQVFVAGKGTTVKAEADLVGRKVAVQTNTTSHDYVKAVQKRGTAIKDLMTFPDATATFGAIKAGQADVIVTDEPVGLYYAKQDPAAFFVTGRAIAPEPIGIAVRKGEEPLQKAIAAAIAEQKADGTFKKLCEKWFGGELSK
jgi:polar amino acid transport system substrate-binding protein